MKLMLLCIAVFFIEISNAENVSWWVYDTGENKCKPSPFDDMHPYDVADGLKKEGVDIELLYERADPAFYVYILNYDDGSKIFLSMANNYSICEQIGTVYFNSFN